MPKVLLATTAMGVVGAMGIVSAIGALGATRCILRCLCRRRLLV